jgi:hypothetical protein
VQRIREFLRLNWVALAFFGVALVLYAIGIGWGLPQATSAERIHPWGTDEIAPLGFGELYYTLLAPDPRYDPRYPLLFYAIEAAFSAPYLLFLYLTGGLTGFSAVFPHGLNDPLTALVGLTLAGRLPSLLSGAGTVTLAYLTGRKLWGHRSGVIAGVITLLLYPMFYYSRTSNVDATMLFFTSVGIYWFAAILEDGFSPRRAIWLGACAALAAATKDAAYAVFAGMAVWLALRQVVLSRRGESPWKPFWQATLAGVGTAAAVYLVSSGMVFNLERYRIHFDFILHGSKEGRLVGFYYSTPATLAGYLTVMGRYFGVVVRSLGIPFTLLVIIGLGYGWRRDRRVLGLALLGVLMWAAIVLPVRFVQARFTLITSYLLALVAAYGAGLGLVDRRRWMRTGVAVLLVSGIVWAGLNAADLTQQMLNDGRYGVVEKAQAWLRPGDRLATPNLDGPWNFPRFSEDVIFEELPRTNSLVTGLPATNRPEFLLIITTHDGSNFGDEFLDPVFYEKLASGTAGYQVVLDGRAPAWFAYPMFRSANPRVMVLMRDDLVEGRIQP